MIRVTFSRIASFFFAFQLASNKVKFEEEAF